MKLFQGVFYQKCILKNSKTKRKINLNSNFINDTIIEKSRGGKMINIQKAKKEFKKYIQSYDIKDKKIALKVAHIERTADIAKQIAQGLQLEKEESKLAELIGLLHDIGRFEQVKRYQTFKDKKSVDHGELGVQILFEQGLIRNFIEDTQYDKIIKIAILNHNRAKKDVIFSNEKEKMHSQIIRDADKTDILYVMTFEDKEAVWEKADLSQEKITDEIYRQFMEEKEIDYQQRKTTVDVLVSHFAFVYGFYYPYGLKIIKARKYFDKIYQRFYFKDKETAQKMESILKKVKSELKEKGEEND